MPDPRRAVLLIVAALGACAAPEPAPVAAEPAAATELLRVHAGQPEQARAVLAVARLQAAALDCPGFALVAEAPRLVRRVPRFDVAGRPVEGIWTTPVRLKGCGATGRLNVLSRLVRGAEETHVGLAPGTTRAEPVVQRDALAAALARLPQALPECRTLRLIDTQPVAGDGGTAAWEEVWMFRGCGRRAMVPVGFRPGPQGGVMAVSEGAVRLDAAGE